MKLAKLKEISYYAGFCILFTVFVSYLIIVTNLAKFNEKNHLRKMTDFAPFSPNKN